MAEQLSKHCWATPKCGISFAEKHFLDIDRNINYKFIMVRNPYNRLVSFYINKVVYQGNPPWNLKDTYVDEVTIPHLGKGNTGISFEEFIKLLSGVNVYSAERHLKPQSNGVLNMKFNKIVKMESFIEDIKEVCEKLDFNYDKIIQKKSNHFERDSSITKKVFDKPSNWFRENSIPKNYELFYTQELKDIVFNLYEKDFSLFNYKK
jgi:hypothetical protein